MRFLEMVIIFDVETVFDNAADVGGVSSDLNNVHRMAKIAATCTMK